jgi:transcription elongation GreA/GreB family factor
VKPEDLLDAAETLRRIAAKVESGEIEASPAQVANLLSQAETIDHLSGSQATS